MNKKFLGFSLLTLAMIISAGPHAYEVDEQNLWQEVYDFRTSYYEKNIGQFPEDILKVGSTTGVWPGGGVYVIEAEKLGKSLWVYTTFGLTNPDMPVGANVSAYQAKIDSQGRVDEYSITLEGKNSGELENNTAGYGYEILLIAKENAEWPLWFMQWSVNAEINNDVGMLQRVEQYNGLTVQEIPVSNNESVNVLITKAQEPLPSGTYLPNGNMELLVATVITDKEMQWSMKNGREKLLERLMAADVGQISDRHRKSVVE